MNRTRFAHLIATSFVMLMFMLPAAMTHAQPAYFQAVTNLNAVGYWPMHENQPTVYADIETNYGTLGTLGTGFYGDWATLDNTKIVHAQPGCIANDPSETSVYFSQVITSPSTGNFTNGLIIPRTSPLISLVAPFSVECWTKGTPNSKQADIWGQGGANNGGLNGTANLSGIRLHWGNTGWTVFCYNGVNGSTLNTLFSYNAGILNSVWYHTVLTDDGTNITLWVNGTNVASAPQAGNYAPDTWEPLCIDAGTGGGKEFADSFGGYIDEFAVYTNALSLNVISNHYFIGTNDTASAYFNAVTNANPVVYFQMDSPGLTAAQNVPVNGLNNYGSAGINGVYRPEVLPGGVSGPGVFSAGFGATNAMPGSGCSSFADVGDSAAYDPTGANTNFTISAWFKGNPTDARVQSIVGHGTNSWQLGLTKDGTVVFNSGTNSASAVATGTGVGDLVSPTAYNDGFWHFAAATHSISTNTLYVDGVPVATNLNSVSIPGSAANVIIGSDPCFTNSPLGYGRQFAGNICEVAYFATNLSAGQIQVLYNDSEMTPVITLQSMAATAAAGSSVTNTVTAIGVNPLSYQWYFNDTPLTDGGGISGTTTNSLIINPVQLANAGNYYCVVTNLYGSTTSAPSTLTVLADAAINAAFPITQTNLLGTNFMTLYAGASPNFSVSASGALPLFYYWFTNGVLDSAATNAGLTLTNAQIGVLNSYCIVSNSIGTALSPVWSATVIANPTNSFGGVANYPQAVLSLNPIAYWRLNEANDGSGNEGVIAQDYAGGNNGIYTNVVLGQPNYSPVEDPSDTSMQVGSGSYPTYSYVGSIGTNIDFSAPPGSNAEYTVACWVNVLANGGGIIEKGYDNGGEECILDTGGPNHAFRYMIRPASQSIQYQVTDSAVPNGSSWYHLVAVCDEANSNLSLYVNGVLNFQTNIPSKQGLVADVPANLTIGAEAQNAGSGPNMQGVGTINDVAVFNYPLTAAQVSYIYNQSGIAPSFTVQPTNVNLALGSNLVDTAVVAGTSPLAYQWFETNLVAMTGYALTNQTNATLTINNLTTNDSYYLVVTNFYGSANSAVVTVGVFTGPMFTSQSPVSYTNVLTLFAGASPTFSVQAISLQNDQPVYYQWFTNGVAQGGATGSSLAVANIQNPFTNFYCVASNLLASSTSFVWNVSVIAAPIDSYPRAALSLHPGGFWRLDELDDGFGDGNPGAIAHDYVGGNNGIYTNVDLGQNGYSNNTDPASVLFGFRTLADADAYGFNIDFGAPAGTTVGFSVEAWVNGYTQNKDAAIVSKGYGGAEQFCLDTGSDGGTPSHAYRFFVRDASGAVHAANSTNYPDPGAQVWHHLVGVCDESNGKVTLYVDGAATASTSIGTTAGVLSSSRSMLIGSRPSSAASENDNQFVGYVDDVAVFNYALTANQVTNEFQGIVAPALNLNPANIVVSLSGGQLTLSWPGDHTGWRLQAQTNGPSKGLGTNWFDVANSQTTNQMIIPINQTNGSVFYRMVYP